MAGYGVLVAASLIFMADSIRAQIPNGIQSPRCKTPTTAPQKIEKVISLCQVEIKLAILKDPPVKLSYEDKIRLMNSSEIFSNPEALEILNETTKEVVHATTGHRRKRELFTEEEQRIAGCLLQCVYRKVKAVDQDGFPTVEGLVRLYAEGVTERGYFIATAQAVQKCLYIGNQQRLSSQKTAPEFYKTEPDPPLGIQSPPLPFAHFKPSNHVLVVFSKIRKLDIKAKVDKNQMLVNINAYCQAEDFVFHLLDEFLSIRKSFAD